MIKNRHGCWTQRIALSVCLSSLLLACGHKEEAPKPTATAKPASTPQKSVPLKRVSDRIDNIHGAVIIAEYHHIADGKNSMFRSPKQFRDDLERLYRMGFRPVTATEFTNNKMLLPPGASPVVMTFDDSNQDQFRLLPNGSVDPTCGVGIWRDFAKTHPDFPVKGTFFILPNSFFGKATEVDAKVKMLHEWGSELGNHTINHPVLKKLSDDQVKAEIGGCALALGKYQPGSLPLAYPFGSRPKNLQLAQSFEYQGQKIQSDSAYMVGANPAKMSTENGFDRFKIPRIQACEGDYGLNYWLDKVERGQVHVYVQP